MRPDPEAGVLDAIRGYTADVFRCPPDSITAVSRLEGGNRHAVYKVSRLDADGAVHDLAIRVSHHGGPGERAQAEMEARVLGRVGDRAAPRLHDFRYTSPWFGTPTICMQFVPGHQRELNTAPPDQLERLGSVVGWIHARPTDDLVASLPVTGDLASYAEGRVQDICSNLVWVRDPLPAGTQARLMSLADWLKSDSERRRDRESFSTGENLVLLHGDVAPGNILWGTGPVLIDWEYARMGDPADEIAYLFDQNGLAPPQRETFWRGYRQSLDNPARLVHIASRVRWWEPVTLLGSTLWWVERWIRRAVADAGGGSDPMVPKEQDYYSEQALRRLDRLGGLLAGRA